jgi:protein-disulfide isomerase
MKRIVAASMLVWLSLFYPDMGFSQSSKELADLKREIEALKTGQLSIQKDLAELKNMFLQKELQAMKEQLQGRPAPTLAAPQAPSGAETQTLVSIEGAMSKGDKNAKLTLVEFTDFQCPFCARHLRDTMPQIENEYIKTGKVRYVLRDFPLESIHPQAFKGHEAANCAAEQDKYWEMHEKLFANQRAMTPKDVTAYAETMGLDMGKFQSCFDSGKYAAKVRKDLTDAQKYGATGTPTFFIGLTDPKSSEIKAVRKIVGAQSYAAFKNAFDTLLGAE